MIRGLFSDNVEVRNILKRVGEDEEYDVHSPYLCLNRYPFVYGHYERVIYKYGGLIFDE